MLPFLVRKIALCLLLSSYTASGTFPHFAARWVDPALGFAVGWVGDARGH